MNKNVPDAVRRLSRERAPQFYKLSKLSSPSTVEIGQIWSTHSRLDLPELPESSTDEPRLIVILDGSGVLLDPLDQVTAVPVSLQTSMATDYDLIIAEAESPLNQRFMVEGWNEFPVLKAHLKQYLGRLSDNANKILRRIHALRLLNEDIPADLREWVGLPLMGENDARVQFQQAEIEAVDYLADVATAALLAGISTQQAVAERLPSTDQKRRFDILPRLGSVADFLRAPKVAYASSTLSGNELIVAQTEGENTFIFEVVVSRREALVYVVIHDISPSIAGHLGSVTLRIPDAELQSQPGELHKGAKIPVAQVSHSFDRKQIQRVIVEIED